MADVSRMPRRGAVPPEGRKTAKKGVMKRLLKILFTHYKRYVGVVALCILLSAVASAVAGPFLEQIYSAIDDGVKGCFLSRRRCRR